MTILYYLGPSDAHRLERDYGKRIINFTRADDEPHPYAQVDQEEAQAIAADAPDLFAIKDALPATVAKVAEVKPVTTRKTAKK